MPLASTMSRPDVVRGPLGQAAAARPRKAGRAMRDFMVVVVGGGSLSGQEKKAFFLGKGEREREREGYMTF